ncbi:TVP38/TMEM64 family protein [Bacillus sp. J33]|uniref:TVP38/TMEM64 family protein n=1 Tax=Bacillus sp. J33 TaxID=935836 RepID=UPI00047D05FC|nr:VTT domain-containing protein [Bacillus sp. J33]
MRKWVILIGYIIILTIGLINKDWILSWIQTSERSSLPIMLFLSTLIAAIPIIPFTIFAGLMGAKFGVMAGLLINWFGGVSASVLYFFLARYFFKGFFSNYLNRVKGVVRFQNMVERNAFIAILLGRMIMIIPPPVINIYSGVTNIPFTVFFAGTVIGNLPPMFLIAYSGEQIFSSLRNLSLGVILYAIFILFILLIYKVWFVPKPKME